MRRSTATSGSGCRAGSRDARLAVPRSYLLHLLSGQPLDELLPPALGALKLVEGVNVDSPDPGGRIGERRSELLQELGWHVAAAQGKGPEPPAMRPQEAGRLAQPDSQRCPQQL